MFKPNRRRLLLAAPLLLLALTAGKCDATSGNQAGSIDTGPAAEVKTCTLDLFRPYATFDGIAYVRAHTRHMCVKPPLSQTVHVQLSYRKTTDRRWQNLVTSDPPAGAGCEQSLARPNEWYNCDLNVACKVGYWRAETWVTYTTDKGYYTAAPSDSTARIRKCPTH